jgi:transposase InsO family protein
MGILGHILAIVALLMAALRGFGDSVLHVPKRRTIAFIVVIFATTVWYLAEPDIRSVDVSSVRTNRSVANLAHSLSEEWLCDSGADMSMTYDLSLFTSVRTTSPVAIHGVGSSSGSKLVSTVRGTVKLPVTDTAGGTHELILTDVLYVPGMQRNLLSVDALVGDGECAFIFDKPRSSIVFHDGAPDVDLVRDGGLYLLPLAQHTHLAAATKTSNVTDEATLMHRRLLHPGRDVASKVFGLKGELPECESCHLNKAQHRSFKKKRPEDKRATVPFHRVHADLWSASECSLGGSSYCLCIVDDFSRTGSVYFLKNKSDAAERFQLFLNEVVYPEGYSVKEFRADHGGEFVGSEFQQVLRDHAIKPWLAPPRSPQSNGTAERFWRSTIPMAKAAVHDAGLPPSFWAEAVQCATYIRNLLPSAPLGGVSPYEVMYDEPPNLDHLRVFGCAAYVLNENAPKFGNNATKMILVGYSKMSSSYRCYNPKTKRFIDTIHVTFDETLSGVSRTDLPSTSIPDCTDPPPSQLGCAEFEPPSSEPSSQSRPRRSTRPGRGTRDSGFMVSEYLAEIQSQCHEQPVQYAFTGVTAVDPSTYGAAMHDACAERWVEAMDTEYQTLMDFNTWELVQLPKGAKMLGSRWVYRRKHNQFGELLSYKARFCVKGYEQRYGVNYSETFSPVVRLASVRLCCALAAMHDWPIYQSDITSAFLHAPVTEEIYVKQPRGYEVTGSRGESNLVLKLRQSLYGIKQGPRNFFKVLNAFLISEGFRPCTSDPCVYVRINEDGKVTIVAIYVDDLTCTGSDFDGVTDIRAALAQRFRIKDLGLLHHYLGIAVTREDGYIIISQKQYVLDLLEKYGMTDCNAVTTPMDPKTHLSKTQSPTTNEERQRMLSCPFRALIGSLFYLSGGTRPDISNAVREVSRHMHNPGWAHWVAAKRILKYLKGTADKGIRYKIGEVNSELTGYADSSWSSCVDTGRSVTGHLFKLAGGAVTWTSRLQRSVAMHSGEAEYYALGDAGKQCMFLRQLLQDLGFPPNGPTTIYEDSTTCVALVNNTAPHGKSRHVRRHHHFVRDLELEGIIRTVDIHTNQQLADGLTKCLQGPKLRSHSARIMGAVS